MADGALDVADFTRLAEAMRPRLHRYCARVVGSAFEAEDVVQEALAKAAEAIAASGPPDRPESWLYRIAHNAALDTLRRRRRRPGEGGSPEPLGVLADPAAQADARVTAASGLSVFLRLPASQRACVVLVDVLGHSLEEASEVLELTVPAVKAALHRGRAGLRALAEAAEAAPPRAMDTDDRRRLIAYADRFNARDFDALRALLAEDVRLDLVARTRLAGAKDVGVYFSRYEERADWRVAVGEAEGRPVLLFTDPGQPELGLTHVALIDWAQGRIAAIRDFKYAPYVLESLEPGAPA